MANYSSIESGKNYSGMGDTVGNGTGGSASGIGCAASFLIAAVAVVVLVGAWYVVALAPSLAAF